MEPFSEASEQYVHYPGQQEFQLQQYYVNQGPVANQGSTGDWDMMQHQLQQQHQMQTQQQTQGAHMNSSGGALPLGPDPWAVAPAGVFHMSGFGVMQQQHLSSGPWFFDPLTIMHPWSQQQQQQQQLLLLSQSQAAAGLQQQEQQQQQQLQQQQQHGQQKGQSRPTARQTSQQSMHQQQQQRQQQRQQLKHNKQEGPAVPCVMNLLHQRQPQQQQQQQQQLLQSQRRPAEQQQQSPFREQGNGDMVLIIADYGPKKGQRKQQEHEKPRQILAAIFQQIGLVIERYVDQQEARRLVDKLEAQVSQEEGDSHGLQADIQCLAACLEAVYCSQQSETLITSCMIEMAQERVPKAYSSKEHNCGVHAGNPGFIQCSALGARQAENESAARDASQAVAAQELVQAARMKLRLLEGDGLPAALADIKQKLEELRDQAAATERRATAAAAAAAAAGGGCGGGGVDTDAAETEAAEADAAEADTAAADAAAVDTAAVGDATAEADKADAEAGPAGSHARTHTGCCLHHPEKRPKGPDNKRKVTHGPAEVCMHISDFAEVAENAGYGGLVDGSRLHVKEACTEIVKILREQQATAAAAEAAAGEAAAAAAAAAAAGDAVEQPSRVTRRMAQQQQAADAFAAGAPMMDARFLFREAARRACLRVQRAVPITVGPYTKGGVQVPERTISYEAIRQCFHMRRDEAGDHLGVPTTTFKTVCQQYGSGRWPGRTTKQQQTEQHGGDQQQQQQWEQDNDSQEEL